MSEDGPPGPLRAGELARKTGLSKDTLRHYERKGLLASRRSPNGYREYDAQAPGRVHLVQRALAVGFTLDELARLMRIRDRGGTPCREVRALAAAKLESIEAQLRDLALLRDQMRTMLGEWDARLARTPRGRPARLLESWGQQAPIRRHVHALARLQNGRRRKSK
jgi:DNA-binding transcriptional MerR regulator